MEEAAAAPPPPPLPPPPSWRRNNPAAAAIDDSSGPLAAAAARLAGRSRALPASRDFHFYHNFPSFRSPIDAAAAKAEASLAVLGGAASLYPKQQPPFPKGDLEDDAAQDWVVGVIDDLSEQFGASLDEFKAVREKEEATGRRAEAAETEEDGFQVVYGKKKKRMDGAGEEEIGRGEGFGGSGSVKMATMDRSAAAGTKAKVPFHIPTIPRPQDVHRILVDNSSKPFEHSWLEKSDDGSRFVHPLEKIPMEQLVDRNVPESEPIRPPELDDTPFTYVDDLKTLEVLATKLKSATEFAVDLEHNHYRSFQGLTCLMQISTRTEDFIVDTLKLRKYLGDYLREIFKDPTKKKVLHGADRDIIWLQRDFGIYICNLFDTGQASRILQMDRNTLEHLLHHFCGVTANKEYAREDTHYLLYIYDLMRQRLVKESSGENDLLLEVYKRSKEICLQLYEKELLTHSSYLCIHGLKENEFDARQLAILSSLYKWRDSVARGEDESTGYILPNKTLLEIAKQMPATTGRLKRIVKLKNSYLDRHLGHVISTIRSAIANCDAFESIAEQLKKGRLEELALANMKSNDRDTEMVPADVGNIDDDNVGPSDEHGAVASVESVGIASQCTGNVTSGTSSVNVQQETTTKTKSSEILSGVSEQNMELLSNGDRKQVAKATVQVSKRPTAFGALLGKPTSGRKQNLFSGFSSEQNKVDKIKSSVALPFHNFCGGAESPATSITLEESVHPEPESIQYNDPACQTEDVIQLDHETDDPQLTENCNEDGQGHREPDDTDMSRSPPEHSSVGVEPRFQSLNESRNIQQNQKPHQEPEFNHQLKPFDYAEARKNVTFGEHKARRIKDNTVARAINKDPGDKGTTSNQLGAGESEGTGQKNPRGRQAFPPSGNRSATYH
uniref:HRDC domain-containing protein n=1 Tax=Leersia perrieri TaxID=77586 RepID=A0A0D9XJZ6_9ORYZ